MKQWNGDFSASPGWETPNSLHPPCPRPAKSAEEPATSLGTTAVALQPSPGRTARGKKLFRYFSTFLTYLVKIADKLIRIMSNSGASKHSAAVVER